MLEDHNKLLSKIKYAAYHLLLSIVTVIFLALLWCVNLLPFRIKLKIGKLLGRCLYYIPNSRIGITDINLKLCFPELSEQQRSAMILEVFENFGAGIVETAMSWWDDQNSIHAITEVRGGYLMDKAREKGAGVLLIGAHFSTLDLSAMLAAKHQPIFAIFRQQSNYILNRVMTKGRLKNLLGAIPHTSLRTAVKKLKNGEVVWYSPDQDMGEDHSVYAPFFGQNAATVTATAKLAVLTGAPVVMMATYRKSDDSGYILEYLEMESNFPVESEVENATAINQLIERGIRLAPSQYYWFHRRFKSQPGIGKAQIYQ